MFPPTQEDVGFNTTVVAMVWPIGAAFNGEVWYGGAATE